MYGKRSEMKGLSTATHSPSHAHRNTRDTSCRQNSLITVNTAPHSPCLPHAHAFSRSNDSGIYHTVVIKYTAGTLEWDGEEQHTQKREKTNKQKNILNRLGLGSFSSQRRGIRYFAFLLKLNDRRSAGFLAFIRPVVQWIIRQWSFAPICRREMRGFHYY